MIMEAARTWLWDSDVKNLLNVTTVSGDVKDAGAARCRLVGIITTTTAVTTAATAAARDVDRRHAVW